MSKYLLLLIAGVAACTPAPPSFNGFTTRGTEVVDRVTGEPVHLIGFGIGGWLLPEGYMWDSGPLNSPRLLEAGIEALIGPEDAEVFWRRYHDNYTTGEDFRAMSLMGVNSVRIALLASKLMPREQVPGQPYHFDPEGFRFLDSVVTWAERYGMGVIWDMHGAPGAQNAENISDSDGEARLWTEPETYWPRLDTLWLRIAERYAGNPHIIGYDLLNEPLLARYDGVDPVDLRRLYVQLTRTIRTVDPEGIMFIEGDDWAQTFWMLEPIDWDPHLVLAFHSYPPTASADGLARWDSLRQRYQVPLWHGETGEVRAPFERNRRATAFLREAGVGWSWWTHKKISRQTQPWWCPPTDGFQRILEYWQGRAERPTREQAREWLMEQADRLRSEHCVFSTEIVQSLDGLDAGPWVAARKHTAPLIFEHPSSSSAPVGGATRLRAGATGFPIQFQWLKDGTPVEGANSSVMQIRPTREEAPAEWRAVALNALGSDTSRAAVVETRPFEGYDVAAEPAGWPIEHVIIGEPAPEPSDLSAEWTFSWEEDELRGRVAITDPEAFNGDSPNHDNDGVELYLDLNNSKTWDYDTDDVQIRAVRGREPVADIGAWPLGLSVTQSETADGWEVVFALPSSLVEGSMLGLELHVIDNDGSGRDHKLAWHGDSDVAWRRSGAFATIRRLAD